jgi:hypothetical protein
LYGISLAQFMGWVFNKIYKIAVLLFLLPLSSSAFGVLTHEAIIDASWETSILPLLRTKYPGATETALKEAHAYAYGGAVAPDMGFYPLGSTMFTNLVHYVRSGDMINALLRDASNVNEYAFALGFLSHYNADNYGHPLATNISVPIVYPKLRKKYGSVITYADNKISHIRMEFGFDVLEIAKGNYASQSYRGFIGFKVDTAVLAKAFFETYALDINEVFNNHFQLATETFRWIVANIFPVITKTAWASKKNFILQQNTTATSKNFAFKMRRREYNKQFGTGYKRPGFLPTMLSFFIRVMPKVGPTRALKFKAPTTITEKYFAQSFDTIMQHFSNNLNQLNRNNISFKDIDFDTGKPTASCEYSLADETYTAWLIRLKEEQFKNVSHSLQQNILNFFHNTNLPVANNSKRCVRFFNAYNELRVMKPSR